MLGVWQSKSHSCYPTVLYFEQTEPDHTPNIPSLYVHLNDCVTSWSQALSTTVKPLMMIYNQVITNMEKEPIRSHH